MGVANCAALGGELPMHTGSYVVPRTIVPTLRYRDVAAAIEWLCRAFGFKRHVIVNGKDGSVDYAELIFGDGMIMLGPVEDSAIGGLMTQPEQAGGAETQICYLFVDDAAAHCAKAKAAGAEIVLDVEDEGSGRGFSCRDPEGHIWNFGTYDPWRRPTEAPSHVGIGKVVGGALRGLALGIGFLALTFAAVVVVAWLLALADPHAVAASREAIRSEERPQPRTAQRDVAERELAELREQLRKERSAREGAERAAREAVERLATSQRERLRLDTQAEAARQRAATESAERIAKETREQLALVERAAGEARAQLDAERAARLDAERASRDATERLEKERAARELAERTSRELREHLSRRRAIRARIRRRLAARAARADLNVAAPNRPGVTLR
jgi:uncharacterized glyoxalase superfamily protein PhnB